MKGQRQFVLRTEEQRTRAQAFVGELPLTDPPLEIVVRTHKSKRSLDQNALYWSLLAAIGAETGNDSEALHEFFKARFITPRKIDIGLPELVTVSGSTARLAVKDFGEYMDRVIAFAAEQGIRLPVLREVA